MLAEVLFSCGRHYLNVAGIAVAVEGDRCRDGDMPDDVYDPIPPEELERGTIGGQPIKGMDVKMVRFFRGDNWTKKMLEYAARRINDEADVPKEGPLA